jgi:hypothetical protein
MSLRFEMNVGISSTYGYTLPEKPRDLQTRQKPSSTDKPLLKVKSHVQKMD